jgi:aspartate/methionine/tyrosine aminotransferase
MGTANQVLARLPTTIFTVMSALANECGAVNLGQGFPDEDGPESLRQAAADFTRNGPSQYPPMLGLPDLRRAVAAHDKRFYGLEVDPMSQVMVTSGATEALAAAFFGLLNAGDEVIILEPAYDSYAPIIRLIGAAPKFVRLQAPDWALPAQELRQAITARTRLIVINTPMNPTGKVFSSAELALIADLAIAHDLIVVCDEVYEHLVFSGAQHIPLMTLPGMADRSVRIASAGKTFSLTGWKVGYITASADIIGRLAKAHQFLTFTTPPALQAAVAMGLSFEDGYYDGLSQDLERKRDFLAQGLEQAGFHPLPCPATYFLTLDVSDRAGGDALAYAQTLTRSPGVASIPYSAFYDGDPPQNLIRLCFSKRHEVLAEAVKRLSAIARQ